VTRQSVRVISMLCLSLVAGANFAYAQNPSVYFGLGTARASSSNQLINTYGTGTLYPTPKLTGLFGTFGGDVMFRPYLGVGAEFSSRFRQGPYAGLKYRPTFYDFNVILQPAPKAARIVPELQAGLGGAKLSFYYSQQFCSIFVGCQTSNAFLSSSSHFQLHAAGGLRIYVTPRVFIRPQIDVHWVNNFFQFGSNVVPQYGVAVGYTLGR
jgi:hypothetical protein